MSGPAAIALYNTWKEQISTPGKIFELGTISCRSIQKYCGEEVSTVSKIQQIILDPARNLLRIYKLQENLFKLCELPSVSQVLESVKDACEALPVFSSIDLVESGPLNYVPYIKTPISFILSSQSLKSSVEAIYSSDKSNQTEKLNAIENLLQQLKTVDGILRNNSINPDGNSLYEACEKLERLMPKVKESADSDQHEILGVLNRMILNSDEIKEHLSSSEISKLQEIIEKSMEKEYSLETLDAISDQFKIYLNSYDKISDTKSLLEVLKCAINWIRSASGMLKLFFLGFGLSGTALFSLEICSFIIRLAISFYKNYLINM